METTTTNKNLQKKYLKPIQYLNVLQKITILCRVAFIAILKGMWPVDSGLDTPARTFFSPCWIMRQQQTQGKSGAEPESHP